MTLPPIDDPVPLTPAEYRARAERCRGMAASMTAPKAEFLAAAEALLGRGREYPTSRDCSPGG
jgi:hypothetical protein